MKLKNGKNAKLGQLVTGPDAHGNQVTGILVSIEETSERNNLGIVPQEPRAFITASQTLPAKDEAED